MAKKGKKLGKFITASFAEDVKTLSMDELAEKIVQSEQLIRSVLEEKKNDERLQAAKNLVKDLGSSYNDAMNVEKAKIQHMLQRLDEINGTELGSNSPTL